MAINSCSFLKRSSPNKSVTSKWCRFGFSGSVKVVYSPKSGCCNVNSSYLDLGVLFLVDTTTRVKILPQKCFLQSSMAKTPETVVNSFVPRVDGGRLLRSSQNVAGAILPS